MAADSRSPLKTHRLIYRSTAGRDGSGLGGRLLDGFERGAERCPALGVSAVELHPVRTEALTRELFRAFVQNKTAVNILFADSRQGIFANRIEKGLRERLTAQDPTFANDPKRGILLSFCVQGCFYAFTNNSSRMDERHLVDLLAEIARAAQKIKM